MLGAAPRGGVEVPALPAAFRDGGAAPPRARPGGRPGGRRDACGLWFTGFAGSEPLQEALPEQRGAGAEILETVIAQERGDFERAQLPEMDRGSVQEAYLDAIVWVREMGGLLRA